MLPPLRDIGIACFALAMAAIPATAFAGKFATLPAVVWGDASAPACRDALLLAEAMFFSKAPHVFAPLVMPAGMRSSLVLGATTLDVADPNSLQVSADFDGLALRGVGQAYWAKRAEAGKRVVVVAETVVRSSSAYALYLLDEAESQAAFKARIEGAPPDGGSLPFTRDIRPPLLFRSPDEQATWLLDLGADREWRLQWHVSAGPVGRAVCTVRLQQPSSGALQTLPAAVRSLVTRLEGTARRVDSDAQSEALEQLEQLVNLAAFRPWALPNGAARHRLDVTGMAGYPSAKRDLARYYARSFGLRPEAANKVAAWVLGEFSGAVPALPSTGDPRREGRGANPWPEGYPMRSR